LSNSDAQRIKTENCIAAESLTDKLMKLRKKLSTLVEDGLIDDIINELVDEALAIEDTERAVELFLAARLLYVVKGVMMEETRLNRIR